MSEYQQWKRRQPIFLPSVLSPLPQEPPKEGCSHGWKRPIGVPCPDCLWLEAATCDNKATLLPLIRKMLRAAGRCVPPEALPRLQEILTNQSNWHVLREARRINQENAR